MFSGELSVFFAYGIKKFLAKRKLEANPENKALILSPGTV